MTTVVNKHGVCRGMCTAVPTEGRIKEVDEERRGEVKSFMNRSTHTELHMCGSSFVKNWSAFVV